MRKFLTFATLSVALAMSFGHAEARTETQAYTAGPIGDHLTACAGEATEDNMGGACFYPLPGDLSATIGISDLISSPGFYVEFRDGADDPIVDGATACETTTFAIPTGTAEIRVWVNGIAFSALGCLGTTGTTGTITVAFA